MHPAAAARAHPGNRPPGVPGNARFGGAGIMFGIMFISTNIVAIASHDDMQAYFNLGYDAFVPMVLATVLPMFLLNSGKLVLVKFCRVLAIIVGVAYPAIILVDAVRLAIYPVDNVLLSSFAGATLILFSPLMFLMWRDYRRSRWLDPRSLPHEWEIAAIHDPNSINYHPPKPPKRRADGKH